MLRAVLIQGFSVCVSIGQKNRHVLLRHIVNFEFEKVVIAFLTQADLLSVLGTL